MEVLRFLEGLRTPFLDHLMSAVTELGGETIFLLVAAAVYWCYDKRFGYYIMTVGFAGTFCNQFLKLVCRVPRPWIRDPGFSIVENAREAATGYSFPSGHTQNAVTVFGSAARWSRRRIVRGAAVAVILLVAFSRMYLGVHTPADVLFSLALGTALTCAFYPLFSHAGEHPRGWTFLFGGMLAVSVLYLLFLEFFPFSPGLDAENFSSAKENAYALAGAVAGLNISYPLERRFLVFETRAPWWGQGLKLLLGIAGIALLKALLHPLFSAAFAGHFFAEAAQYFLIVLFAVAGWPAVFPLLQKLWKRA